MGASGQHTRPSGRDRPDPEVARWALAETRRIVVAVLAGRKCTTVLFGSFATGRADRLSDIDVGVLPAEPLPVGLLAEIRERLEESQVPYDVDLVDLSECDPAFRARVLEEGVPWTA